MATYFSIKPTVTVDMIAKIKTKQSRELLMYLFNKYGYNEVDQKELMKELNLHQDDNLVFSEGTEGVISRTYEFYRRNEKSGWWNAGLIEIRRTSKAKSAASELEELKERIKELENLLEENEIEFDHI